MQNEDVRALRVRDLYRTAEARHASLRLLAEAAAQLSGADDASSPETIRLGLGLMVQAGAFDCGALFDFSGEAADVNADAYTLRCCVDRNGQRLEDPANGSRWPGIIECEQSRRPFLVLQTPLNVLPLPPETVQEWALVLALPLISPANKFIGALALARRQANATAISDEDLRTLQLLAGQLAAFITTANLIQGQKRLMAELSVREQELAALVQKLFDAQENERKKLANDLHDGLLQVCSSALQHLQAAQARYPESFYPASPAGMGLELCRRAVREARGMIGGMRPVLLDDFGLEGALVHEVGAMRRQGWEVEWQCDSEGLRLPAEQEIALFRIASEALTNIRKHAGPCAVAVSLTVDANVVVLRVEDNGTGFSASIPKSVGYGEHIGLTAMRERATAVGGHMSMVSANGRGTALEVRLPKLPQTKMMGAA